MQVKKFEAPTIQEALDTIKRELGPEAIILQTKRNRSGFGLMSKGSVEVTAAVSDRSMQKKQYVEKRLPEPSREKVRGMAAEKQASLYEKYEGRRVPGRPAVKETEEVSASAKFRTQHVTSRRYIEIDAPPAQAMALPLEEELRHLKRMIEEMKQEQSENAANSASAAITQSAPGQIPSLQDAYEQLVVNGVDKRYAFQLIKKAGFELGEAAENPDAVLELLAGEIMRTSSVASSFAHLRPDFNSGSPAVIALVGPTGVGKTTTVAKMASEAILKRGLKVGLINLDTYKIAAFDQLGTYAKILNVPFRSVSSLEDLQAAMADFKALDLVLFDTTGRSQRDPGALQEMNETLRTIPDIRTQLVLSVTTRDNELYDMANRFAIFKPQGIIVSKLDEATIYGSVYNLSQKVKLPLLYFTTGQRVPEDIEEASRERVASLILDI